MKVSQNFDIREFVPKSIWDEWGTNSTWFVQEKVIKLAQFYKEFFLKYFQNKDPDVADVLIIVNNWYYAKAGDTIQQYRGFRPITYTGGGKLSQHRGGAANAFDCDIILVYKDGSRKEADYNQIHHIILIEYPEMFFEKGLRAIEDISIAKTWLHSDCRWIIGAKTILVVKPINS